MNGSSISNFKSHWRITNNDTNDTCNLDIFQIATSYFDVPSWGLLNADGNPLNDSGAAANVEGQVTWKGIHPADLSIQDWNNLKTQQHYMQHMGTVTIGNADNENTVELELNRIPPKVRRSQTGMFWGLLFLYDFTKNSAAVADLDFNQTVKFDEHPSDQRLPYLT